MFATFRCQNCNNKIVVDFSKPNNIPSSCSKCGSKFSNSHYISSFADKFLSLQRALYDLEFCGLTSSKPDIVYDTDLKTLDNLYFHSSVEVKKLLTRILDLNFLMIYHDAKDENIEALKRYIYVLEVLHGEKVDSKYNKVVKLLKPSDN